MVTCTYHCGEMQEKETDSILKNNVFIKGNVLSIKQSNNHDFGIILLDVDSANVKEFIDTLKNGFYPYRVEHGKAELYATISDGISIGDKVIINSNERKATYYYHKSNQRFEGFLNVITGFNLEYVKENTSFK
jgi:hypothetical protein